MSEWKKVKLGDYIDVLPGFAYKSKDFSDSGIPVIKIKNVSPPRITLDDLSYVPEAIAYQNPRYILKKGDVLIAMTGSHINQIASVVGRVGRVHYDDITVLNQRVGKIVNKNESLSCLDFIYYYLSQYEVKVELAQKAGGAANQANISPADIKNLMIPCPPIEIQHLIASTLSRYDSLIENYQKQIKLLEEAAQRLYKEWFVDLHFPGYENTKIVDGVPKGWEKKPVDSIYSIKYGKNLSTKLIAESGKYPVYGANGVIGYYDKYNCSEQVVLITSRGNGSGDVLMTYHKDAFITNNSFIVSPLKEYSYCQVPFTYLFLKNANFRAVRTGAAQPQLTNQSIHTVDVVLPSKDIIISFCNVLSHNNGMVIGLKNQIRLLTEARDRLLPKLMSGEIEVGGDGLKGQQSVSPMATPWVRKKEITNAP